MRLAFVILALGLTTARAFAQAAPSPAPAAPCVRQDVPLAGGIGRASVVAFTGKTYGERVCALVANLAGDAFDAAIGPASSDDAVVTAAITKGTGGALAVRPSGLAIGPADAAGVTAPDAYAVGPFVVTPGGGFPSFGGDASEVPRVVLAYAGQRVLLVRTTAITLIDLTHALREQSSMFGTDAAERAVVLAAGDDATMQVRTADGVLGPAVMTPVTLRLVKRR